MIAAYEGPNRALAGEMMTRLIAALTSKVPDARPELAKLGRTLRNCSQDVLALFDRPGNNNGPTEEINNRPRRRLGFLTPTESFARLLAGEPHVASTH